MRYALRGVDVLALAAVRYRSRIVNDGKFGVARPAQEDVFQDALAGEAVWEFVGDDVDDYAFWADLGGCGSIG